MFTMENNSMEIFWIDWKQYLFEKKQQNSWKIEKNGIHTYYIDLAIYKIQRICEFWQKPPAWHVKK